MKRLWLIVLGGLVFAAILWAIYCVISNIPVVMHGRKITDVQDVSAMPKGKACDPSSIYVLGDSCQITGDQLYSVYVLLNKNGYAMLMSKNAVHSTVVLDNRKIEGGQFALQHVGVSGSVIVHAVQQDYGYRLNVTVMSPYVPYGELCKGTRMAPIVGDTLVWQGADINYRVNLRTKGSYYELRLEGPYGDKRLDSDDMPQWGAISTLSDPHYVMNVANCGGDVLGLMYDISGPFEFPGRFH